MSVDPKQKFTGFQDGRITENNVFGLGRGRIQHGRITENKLVKLLGWGEGCDQNSKANITDLGGSKGVPQTSVAALAIRIATNNMNLCICFSWYLKPYKRKCRGRKRYTKPPPKQKHDFLMMFVFGCDLMYWVDLFVFYCKNNVF